MGKGKKEHRKKVEARNQKMKAADNAMQKLFQESMKRQLAELQPNVNKIRCRIVGESLYPSGMGRHTRKLYSRENQIG